MENGKRGLVLQGGAMRGIYTAGVLDVFLEQKIAFDGVIGVSAGAIHGASYISQQAGRNIGYFTKYIRDPRFMGIGSLLRTGDLFGVQFGYHDIPEKLVPFDEAAFEANPAAFYVTCTNIETGNPVYHRCATMRGDDLEYLRASASMPLVSNIVQVGGKKLLDGGLSDNVPMTWFRSAGYDRCVVVLTQPRGYRKKPSSAWVFEKKYGRAYPALVASMADRAEKYNAELDEIDAAERRGEVFVIRPTADLAISRTERNPEKLRAQYGLGRRDAFAQIEALRAWLA
jgi:predicted patatin/cPLA2 family phospholipase